MTSIPRYGRSNQTLPGPGQNLTYWHESALSIMTTLTMDYGSKAVARCITNTWSKNVFTHLLRLAFSACTRQFRGAGAGERGTASGSAKGLQRCSHPTVCATQHPTRNPLPSCMHNGIHKVRIHRMLLMVSQTPAPRDRYQVRMTRRSTRNHIRSQAPISAYLACPCCYQPAKLESRWRTL